jgi:hypothetical protein
MSINVLDMRIAVSWRTLTGWATLLPTLQPEGTLQMVRDEVELLDRWAEEYPERSDALLALADRWRRLAVRLKARAN